MAKKRRETKPTTARRRRRASGEDLISKLPDEILTHILSYLPTQSSVATCVLSKRWSRLWISVPNLDFGWCYLDSSVSLALFEDFMDRFLSLNTVMPVRSITLELVENDELSRVNSWLAAFGERDAEKVDLCLPEGGEIWCPIYSLPDNFFTQNNLLNLKLTTVVLKVPDLVCFPNLKKIKLRSVQLVDESSLKNLLSGSPVLKTLWMYLDKEDKVKTLHLCSSSLRELYLHFEEVKDIDYHVEIDSPNLTYLSLTCFARSTFNIVNASLLPRAYLCINDGEILLKLLTQISHVKKLHFFLYLMSDLPGTSYANLPMLHNLIHLTVEIEMTDFFGDCGCLSRLLHCTPNLLTFSLEMDCTDDDYDWFEPYEVPQCFLSSIKSVDIKWVRDDGNHDLRMITYILKNAMVLNKLSIHAYEIVNETKFLTTLLSIPRSSATCEVKYKLV